MSHTVYEKLEFFIYLYYFRIYSRGFNNPSNSILTDFGRENFFFQIEQYIWGCSLTKLTRENFHCYFYSNLFIRILFRVRVQTEAQEWNEKSGGVPRQPCQGQLESRFLQI